jgi:hypothetical protein
LTGDDEADIDSASQLVEMAQYDAINNTDLEGDNNDDIY